VALDFRVLGPLEVARDGTPLRLGGPKQRALLALLLLEAGELVPTERIVEEVWHGGRGGSPRSVQVYVSELRKVLGDPDRIRGEAGGYQLTAGPEEIDARRFERLVEEGRRARVSGEASQAAEMLREALGLWRGAPLADLAYESWAQAESTRLEELRLDSAEELIEAELALGRHREVVPEIEGLVATEPLRERPRRQLMLALYRCGRQAEALEAYQDARRTLVDELGLEPGPELRELEAAILRQDRSLLVEPAELRARRRLPAPPTELVGRRREVAEVVELLQDGSRLVTLTGPGGTGKTRVALQAAHELAERFEDGVVFVGLAALRDPQLVPEQIAGALGVEVRERAVLGEVAKHLHDRTTLLLVDNFEQVDEAAPALASLLGEAPSLKLLVTSRHPLRVYGEHEFPVAPLALDEEAVPLFLQRARATGQPVQPSDDVREICRHLDCLPLAIELAAARTRELATAEMRAMLASRLDLASEGPRDLPARQQTLRATIEWSYELLDAREQQLFAGLGVFAGGCTQEAAAAVCDADPEPLASLVENSLVVEQEGRFAMLETIREYALERLAEEHDEAVVRRRHGEHFVQLGIEAKPALKGADAEAWLRRLESEHDNLRAALEWSLEHHPNGFLRLVDALFRFWVTHGHNREGLRWYERARTVAEADVRARADVLKFGAGFAFRCGELSLAHSLGEEALALYRELADPADSARALTVLGLVRSHEGEHAAAVALLGESIALARESGSEEVISFTLSNLAHVALQAGDPERAHDASLEALERFREIGPEGERADELVTVFGNLGLAALFQGRHSEARAHLAESLSLALRFRDHLNIAAAFTGLAAIAGSDGEYGRAARLLGGADAVCERAEIELEPVGAELYERTAEAARSELTDEGFARAREEGRNLELEEAAAAALDVEATA
jgi:predicted ATPase/DNA-binding SARP family transcriptional activator